MSNLNIKTQQSKVSNFEDFAQNGTSNSNCKLKPQEPLKFDFILMSKKEKAIGSLLNKNKNLYSE